MNAAIRVVGLMLLALLPGAGFPQSTSGEPATGVHVTGRVTDARGRPLWSVALYLSPLDPGDTTPPVLLFSPSGVPPKKYKFVVPGGAFKIRPATLDVGSRDIDVGDIIVQPDVRGDLKLEQIIVDPLVTTNFEGMGAMRSPLATNQQPLSCSDDWFQYYRSVEAFLGGKVKAIRVFRFPRSSESVPADIQSRFMEAWLGVFRAARCFMVWAEPTFWDLGATIEYEDGKRSSMLTDGFHVQVQDREGRVWFIRLWPAVD
jgi:hypothetical protein